MQCLVYAAEARDLTGSVTAIMTLASFAFLAGIVLGLI